MKQALFIFFLVIICLPLLAPDSTNAATPAPIKIMPLGDSITFGAIYPGAYRVELWQKFVANNIAVDFVGSQNNGPTSLGDKDNEGHNSKMTSYILSNLDAWLTTYQPDIVLLLIGTNDVQSATNAVGAPERTGQIIDMIASKLPNTRIVVASIPPLLNSSANTQRALDYNAALPAVITARQGQGKKVFYVDMYQVLTKSLMSSDLIHPNTTGYNKMGDKWYEVLIKNNILITTPSLTPTPPYLRSDFGGLGGAKDGKVDIQDFNILAGEFYLTGTTLKSNIINTGLSTDKVDIQDYNAFVGDYQAYLAR